MAVTHHWDYYAALEEDVKKLTRFIHFSESNFDTYSTELARLLMASTQEIDVLFHQICEKHGDPSATEAGYRRFFAQGNYAKIRGVKILIGRYGLNFTPFSEWDKETPEWWTANNKVKHERHAHFEMASLRNVLNSLSALLIANMYFANETGTLTTDFVPATFLIPEKLIKTSLMGASSFTFKMP